MGKINAFFFGFTSFFRSQTEQFVIQFCSWIYRLAAFLRWSFPTTLKS
jgi:hypothetical protein